MNEREVFLTNEEFARLIAAGTRLENLLNFLKIRCESYRAIEHSELEMILKVFSREKVEVAE